MMKHRREDDFVFSSGTKSDKNPTQQNETIWTVEEVAEYLKLQPETIRSMARRGELPAIKLGKVWRFSRRAIHEKLRNSQ
jgi:excisionase family DNA binding protein